jgi:hypothetical protein
MANRNFYELPELFDQYDQFLNTGRVPVQTRTVIYSNSKNNNNLESLNQNYFNRQINNGSLIDQDQLLQILNSNQGTVGSNHRGQMTSGLSDETLRQLLTNSLNNNSYQDQDEEMAYELVPIKRSKSSALRNPDSFEVDLSDNLTNINNDNSNVRYFQSDPVIIHQPIDLSSFSSQRQNRKGPLTLEYHNSSSNFSDYVDIPQTIIRRQPLTTSSNNVNIQRSFINTNPSRSNYVRQDPFVFNNTGNKIQLSKDDSLVLNSGYRFNSGNNQSALNRDILENLGYNKNDSGVIILPPIQVTRRIPTHYETANNSLVINHNNNERNPAFFLPQISQSQPRIIRTTASPIIINQPANGYQTQRPLTRLTVIPSMPQQQVSHSTSAINRSRSNPNQFFVYK